MSSIFGYGFGTIAIAVLLTACAQSYPSSLAVPSATHVATAGSVTEKVVHSFAGGKDGSYPQASPILIKGMLYGTTVLGGGAGCAVVHGCGTVYALDASGGERVLHAFKGGTDGEAPDASLIARNGDIFGTTNLGGNSGCKNGRVHGCGTIFEITPGGRERILYRFPGEALGARPGSGLTSFGGELYGEAGAGGGGTCDYDDIPGCGLIFKFTPPEEPQIVVRFAGRKGGGAPQGGLLAVKDTLYGTGSAGGGTACLFSYGCGTAFALSAAGTLTTLHSFGRTVHTGALPESGLVDLSGTLYGTTFSGGAYDCALTGSFTGCGTVFRVTPSGTYRQLYSFAGGGDGAYPNGLIAVNGTLYGTAGDNTSTCGIFFSIRPNGTETTLYQFQGGSDGCGPTSLLFANGTFYGTTGSGGAHGDGTVFSITL